MHSRVRSLYKQLLYMGKEYPVESGGYIKFSKMLKSSFRKTPTNTPEELDQAIEKGQYIIKELETLYFLKRYRHLKRSYGYQ